MDPIDPKQKIEEICSFIQQSFRSAGLSAAIIGVSGGIDSATSLALTVKALGNESVYPILLPYSELNAQGVTDALLAISSLSISDSRVQIINIQPVVDSIVSYDSSIENLRKGNIMARVRMMFLFDQAKKHQALVVGTENKTEHYLGYYTRFGDEASDVEPLRSLYKTQVYQLAKELEIPEPLLTKAPTAGLWEGQTDEDEFGFSYDDADRVIHLTLEEGKTTEELVRLGIKRETVERILYHVATNAFKKKLPYLL